MNIFTKFINFIKRIFGNEEQKRISEKKKINVEIDENSNFLDELKLYKEENPELLKIQKQYEENKIELCQMSNEQIHDLNLLYQRQVNELKEKLNDRKTELTIMQYRVKKYSTNA